MFLDAPTPIERIVTDHGTEITRVAHIEFEAVAAMIERKLKGRNRILRRIFRSATMAEQEWAGGSQWSCVRLNSGWHGYTGCEKMLRNCLYQGIDFSRADVLSLESRFSRCGLASFYEPRLLSRAEENPSG